MRLTLRNEKVGIPGRIKPQVRCESFTSSLSDAWPKVNIEHGIVEESIMQED
jgi:hypothetical protein